MGNESHCPGKKKVFDTREILPLNKTMVLSVFRFHRENSSLWICQLETIEYVLKECPVDSVERGSSRKVSAEFDTKKGRGQCSSSYMRYRSYFANASLD